MKKLLCLLFFLAFRVSAQTPSYFSKEACIGFFEAYAPSFESQSEQNVAYKVYAFRDKKWFKTEKWYLALVTKNDIAFFYKEKEQIQSHSFLLNNAICIIVQNGDFTFKNKAVNLYDLSIKAYYEPNRKALRLLRRAKAATNLENPLYIETSDSLQKIQKNWQAEVKNLRTSATKIQNMIKVLGKSSASQNKDLVVQTSNELKLIDQKLKVLEDATQLLPVSPAQQQQLTNIKKSRERIVTYSNLLKQIEQGDKKVQRVKNILQGL